MCVGPVSFPTNKLAPPSSAISCRKSSESTMTLSGAKALSDLGGDLLVAGTEIDHRRQRVSLAQPARDRGKVLHGPALGNVARAWTQHRVSFAGRQAFSRQNAFHRGDRVGLRIHSCRRNASRGHSRPQKLLGAMLRGVARNAAVDGKAGGNFDVVNERVLASRPANPQRRSGKAGQQRARGSRVHIEDGGEPAAPQHPYRGPKIRQQQNMGDRRMAFDERRAERLHQERNSEIGPPLVQRLNAPAKSEQRRRWTASE